MEGSAGHSVQRRRDAFIASSGEQAEGPTSLFLSALDPTPQASDKAIVIPLNLAVLPSLAISQINLFRQ